MTTAIVSAEAWPLVVHFGPLLKNASDDDFFEFCQRNRDLRIERTSEGEVIVMPPAGGESGSIEFKLGGAFFGWVEADGTGLGFSSSTGFRLPNGATRSPDLAWVKSSRWKRLPARQRKRFPPLCPDFVAEVRSENDSLRDLSAKMQEYLDNGARLGWLIDPLEKKVYVYRPGAEPERLDNPETLSGDPVLPGFTLDVRRLWS
jgi:Uma2 family endonuclease